MEAVTSRDAIYFLRVSHIKPRGWRTGWFDTLSYMKKQREIISV